MCTRRCSLEIQFSINAHKLISSSGPFKRSYETQSHARTHICTYTHTPTPTLTSTTHTCIKSKTFQFTFCCFSSIKYPRLSKVFVERFSPPQEEWIFVLRFSIRSPALLSPRLVIRLFCAPLKAIPHPNSGKLRRISYSVVFHSHTSIYRIIPYATRIARLSAPEIPHHAAQTLVNYFYYIHSFTCTVTQFIGCESVSGYGYGNGYDWESVCRVPYPVFHIPDKWAPAPTSAALLPVAFASGTATPQLMWSAVNMRQRMSGRGIPP